jgi:hypothetical protein
MKCRRGGLCQLFTVGGGITESKLLLEMCSSCGEIYVTWLPVMGWPLDAEDARNYLGEKMEVGV